MTTITTKISTSSTASSVLYVRPQTIEITIKNARPATKLFTFFDGTSVNRYCYITTPVKTTVLDSLYNNVPDNIGPDLFTDENGSLTFFFDVPETTFNIGPNVLLVSENSDGSNPIAFTTFDTDSKSKSTAREVANLSNGHDPLVQTFFTYGITGGCFITALELFFQTKDQTLPVKVELREVVNGLPSNKPATNTDHVCVLSPSQISVSSNGSVGTKFKFSVPLYLEESKDYCFAIITNSSKYNLWTAKLGDASQETGKLIFNQPRIGSLFKEENSTTWTANQFEDIKFNLYSAEFSNDVPGPIVFGARPPKQSIPGTAFTTTAGSQSIIYKSIEKHGMTEGSFIRIWGEVGGVYNGIPSSQLSNQYYNDGSNALVTKVIDDHTLLFNTQGVADKTGPITSCGFVKKIVVLNGGTGFSSPPTVTVSMPDTGTDRATAVAYLTTSGAIDYIKITNPGSGYTSQPTVSISGVGNGASVVAIVDAVLLVETNKPVNLVVPKVLHSVVGGTKLSSTFQCYTTSNSRTPEQQIELGNKFYLQDDGVIPGMFYASIPSYLMVNMHTDNKNISPVLDLRLRPSLLAYANDISKQSQLESLSANVSYGGIMTVEIVNPGIGYDTVPTITVIRALNDLISGPSVDINAVIDASILSGSVNSIAITIPGRYTQLPKLVVTPPTGAGTTAELVVTKLTPFNSEIATKGTASTRYLTKKIVLETVSSGIHLFCSTDSRKGASVDWYIRSSLSGNNTKHEDRPWVLLKCDTERNKSGAKGKFFEYEFYTEGLSLEQFDTYDLKCVMTADTPSLAPHIKQYRVIATA